LPNQTDNRGRSAEIVAETGRVMADAMKDSSDTLLGRDDIARHAQERAEALVEEYFDINDLERVLVNDTDAVVIPSVRPTRARIAVPTILPAKDSDRHRYTELLCETLNSWAAKEFQVHGKWVADSRLGMGLVVLEKTPRGQSPTHLDAATKDILATLDVIQEIAGRGEGPLRLARGLKAFHKTLLYVTKPIGLRFWTSTAALNDADEIAGSLLMRPLKEDA
jgi:hypothetical protein